MGIMRNKRRIQHTTGKKSGQNGSCGNTDFQHSLFLGFCSCNKCVIT